MTGSAKDFAVWAHGAQMYGERPYVAHLEEVAEVVRGIEGLPEYAVKVAYLHDVIEDTPIRRVDVERWFDFGVGVCVFALTDPPGQTRRDRKELLHARLKRLDDSETSRTTLAVKAADRIANVRASTAEGKSDLLRMYQKEHEAFREAVYRPGLCDELWAELDGLLAW